jgi:hypothetical protein
MATVKNAGLKLPIGKVTVNLAPARPCRRTPFDRCCRRRPSMRPPNVTQVHSTADLAGADNLEPARRAEAIREPRRRRARATTCSGSVRN